MLFCSSLIGQVKKDTFNEIQIKEKLSGIKVGKSNIYSEKDTIPVIINLGEIKSENNPLWYLNGQLVDEESLSTINPHRIEKMSIEKKPSQLNKPKPEWITDLKGRHI